MAYEHSTDYFVTVEAFVAEFALAPDEIWADCFFVGIHVYEYI